MASQNQTDKLQWEREQKKELYWRNLLNEWKASGITIRAFAKLKDVSEHSLYGWRRELRMRDREAAIAEGCSPSDADESPRFANDARGRVLNVRFKDTPKSNKKADATGKRNRYLFMTPEERREFWFPHVEEFDRSGLSAVEFCRLNKLNIATFSEWRRRYKKERIKWKQAQRDKVKASKKSTVERLSADQFISVSLIESEKSYEAQPELEQTTTRVQYRNTAGEVIEITAEMRLAEMIEIIKELKNKKC
jgi:hypothetical protein